MSSERDEMKGDGDARSDESLQAPGGDDENKILREVKQQQDEDDPQKLPHEEQQQEEIRYLDAQGFYEALTNQAEALDIARALDDDVELPVWPHDSGLTDDLIQVWKDAKMIIRSKQETKQELQQKTWGYDDLDPGVKSLLTRAVFDDLPDQQKESFFAGIKKSYNENNQLQKENNQLKIKEKLRDIQKRSKAISLRSKEISDLLLDLCGHSQERIESTKTWKQSENKRQKLNRAMNKDLEEENPKFQTQRARAAEQFYEDSLLLEGPFFSQAAILDMEVPDRIERIAEVYNAAFANTKNFLLSPKATQAHGFGRQTKQEGVYRKELDATLNKMDQALNDKTGTITLKKNESLPGPRSQEVEGVQPMFAWLLDNILTVLRTQDGDSATTDVKAGKRHSPFKSTRGNEAPVIDFRDNQPVRYGDYVFIKDGCSLTIYPPDCIPIIMELKPYFRAGAGHLKVMQGGLQQDVLHLSKFLSACFNWSGPGMDSFGTGLLATLAYVRVVKVELVGVGTENCRIRLLESKCFPLLHRTNFEKWLDSNGPTGSSEEETRNLTEELYPDGYLEDQIPCGFKLLYRLLTMKSEDLFGTLWRGGDNKDNDSFKVFLGSGTFSYVFEGPKK